MPSKVPIVRGMVFPVMYGCFLCSQRWRSSIQSTKTRPGADCGSDHELLIAKFRLKLKKVGKTTRPFRYDLNQIPYDYTVEVRNRFKGLDLIDRVPDELWNEVRDIVQETGIIVLQSWVAETPHPDSFWSPSLFEYLAHPLHAGKIRSHVAKTAACDHDIPHHFAPILRDLWQHCEVLYFFSHHTISRKEKQ